MICTTGIWTVRRGREDEFARRWQESAARVALEFPDVRFRLLRDRDNRQRFVSLGEGWRNHDQAEAARSSPSYQDSLAGIRRLLESGEVSTLELVADVS